MKAKTKPAPKAKAGGKVMRAVPVIASRAVRGVIKRRYEIDAPAAAAVSPSFKAVSGSRAAALFGAHPFTSRRELAVQISGDGKSRTPETEIMRIGSALEPVVYRLGCDKFGARPLFNDGEKPLHLRAPALSLAGTPDAIIMREGEPVLVEIKTGRRQTPWDEVPPPYIVQVQTYLLLTGLAEGEIWALHGGSELARYPVAADREMQARIINKVGDLHAELEAGHLPEPETEGDYRHAFTELAALTTKGAVKEITDPALARLAQSYNLTKKRISAVKKHTDDDTKSLELELVCAMGGCERMVVNDGAGGAIVFKHTISERKEFVMPAAKTRRFTATPRKDQTTKERKGK